MRLWLWVDAVFYVYSLIKKKTFLFGLKPRSQQCSALPQSKRVAVIDWPEVLSCLPQQGKVLESLCSSTALPDVGEPWLAGLLDQALSHFVQGLGRVLLAWWAMGKLACNQR